MNPLKGVVVCHGDLAPSLVRSTEEITGVHDVLTAISNTGCNRDQLEQRIVAAVGDQPAVLFVDMPSGSCLFAAARRLANLSGTKMVTGVNLAMLLDFVFHRGLTPEEAAARAIEIGAKAITVR